MPEPEEIDTELDDGIDYELENRDEEGSPYPVDDRHMIDSIYRIVSVESLEVHRMYRTYDTLKYIVSLFLYALFGGLIGLAIVTML